MKLTVCPDCGYRCLATTAAQALYGLSRHSCDRHRARDEQRARGDTRRAAYGTVVRDCAHTLTRHEHGTRSCYVLDRCRCTPCSRANVAAERTRTRQKAYGRWQPYVDAGPARAHIHALRAAGVGLKTIARRAGVPHGSMSKLLYGDPRRGLAPSKRIRPATAQRLLALPLEDAEHLAADGARVAAGPTWDRVRGLVALGYPKAWISAQIGQNGTVLQLGADHVSAAHARTVRELAEHVGDTAGPSQRARNYAAARGWLTPLQQWAVAPEFDDTAAAVVRTSKREERTEDARWLVEGGCSTAEAATRLGVTEAYLVDLLTEHGAAA